MEFTSKSMIE